MPLGRQPTTDHFPSESLMFPDAAEKWHVAVFPSNSNSLSLTHTPARTHKNCPYSLNHPPNRIEVDGSFKKMADTDCKLYHIHTLTVHTHTHTHTLSGTWPASQPPSSANVGVISRALREAVSSMLLLEYETNNYSRNPLTEAALT